MPPDTGWQRSKPWPNHRRIKANSPCISNQQMKINKSPAKMDTQVCSKQMDLLMALNEYSIWRSAASRWT
jgi:hypothetical protein